jgi:hypothetical protein
VLLAFLAVYHRVSARARRLLQARVPGTCDSVQGAGVTKADVDGDRVIWASTTGCIWRYFWNCAS